MQILRQTGVAVRFLIVATVVLGVLYPLVVFGFSRIVADRADGAFLADSDGAVIGAENIGQVFEGPQWFHPRPSAAGDGYDALASSGSNLAADNPELIDEVAARKVAVAKANGVAPSQVPADAVTASSSGLDPHISPEYAELQVNRVARSRGMDPAAVTALVDEYTDGAFLGIFGQPRVNVLKLNLALSQQG